MATNTTFYNANGCLYLICTLLAVKLIVVFVRAIFSSTLAWGVLHGAFYMGRFTWGDDGSGGKGSRLAIGQ